MEYILRTIHFNSISVGGGGVHMSNLPRSVSDELIKRGLAWTRQARSFENFVSLPVSRVACL